MEKILFKNLCLSGRLLLCIQWTNSSFLRFFDGKLFSIQTLSSQQLQLWICVIKVSVEGFSKVSRLFQKLRHGLLIWNSTVPRISWISVIEYYLDFKLVFLNDHKLIFILKASNNRVSTVEKVLIEKTLTVFLAFDSWLLEYVKIRFLFGHFFVVQVHDI